MKMNEKNVMEENLSKIVYNENYFSCFIEHIEPSEPTNPFEKKVFDKNLRRSAISCENYRSHREFSPKSIYGESFKLQQSRIERQHSGGKSQNTRDLIEINQKNAKFNQNTDSRYQKVLELFKKLHQQIDYMQEKTKQHLQEIEHKLQSNLIDQQERDKQISCAFDNIEKVFCFMTESFTHIVDGGSSEFKIQQKNSSFATTDQKLRSPKLTFEAEKQNRIADSNFVWNQASEYSHRALQILSNKEENVYVLDGSGKNMLTSEDKQSKQTKCHRPQKKFYQGPFVRKLENPSQRHKSVYEAVLDERQKRIKQLKKKVL